MDLPTNDAPSDMDDVSMSDVHFGSYGSYGSFESVDSMALETPNTATSSMSEAYVFPIAGSPFGSPRGMNPLVDLKLQGMLVLVLSNLTLTMLRGRIENYFGRLSVFTFPLGTPLRPC